MQDNKKEPLKRVSNSTVNFSHDLRDYRIDNETTPVEPENMPVKEASDYDFLLSCIVQLLKVDITELIIHLSETEAYPEILETARKLNLQVSNIKESV